MIRRVTRRLGQHFLEPAWVSKVMEAISPCPTDVFLEIGPGRGALTLPLAARVTRVLGIEVDWKLAENLRAQAPLNVTILTADFLAADLERLAGIGPKPWRAMGNLPYSISPKIIRRLLSISAHGTRLRDATVMLQREVADRVTAEPGSPDWGPLAVMTSLHADARRLLALPPGAFRPMPRVSSALVNLRFIPPPIRLSDPVLFEALVRRLFSQRRKMALNALRGFVDEIGGLSTEKVFTLAKVDPHRRPGELKLSELADLSEVLASLRS